MVTQPVRITRKDGVQTTVHRNVDKGDNELASRAFRLNPKPVDVNLLDAMEVHDIQGTYDLKKVSPRGVLASDNYGQYGIEIGLANKSSMTFGQTEVAPYVSGWTGAKLVRSDGEYPNADFTLHAELGSVPKESFLRNGDKWENKKKVMERDLKETYGTSVSFTEDPENPDMLNFNFVIRIEDGIRAYDFVGNEEVTFVPLPEAMQELQTHKPFNSMKEQILNGQAINWFS